ncbi:hypothetical protein [Micromonospora thermarum]|uniref:Uncharacterized protein n=1 Tax=Micromonospora thermarum TaxID=2720024 RepID=A0ABX0Z7X7_9ACTN|nr:hypothetical protein [Micromonospora thermarum]NJP32045.1 hypothetical protein [Micromonospora thermarum]
MHVRPLIDDLLAGFTPPRPYTMEAAADAPRAPGVHVVLEGGTVTTSVGPGTCATGSGST